MPAELLVAAASGAIERYPPTVLVTYDHQFFNSSACPIPCRIGARCVAARCILARYIQLRILYRLGNYVFGMRLTFISTRIKNGAILRLREDRHQ